MFYVLIVAIWVEGGGIAVLDHSKMFNTRAECEYH
jgi:hypothetical protein